MFYSSRLTCYSNLNIESLPVIKEQSIRNRATVLVGEDITI